MGIFFMVSAVDFLIWDEILVKAALVVEEGVSSEGSSDSRDFLVIFFMVGCYV